MVIVMPRYDRNNGARVLYPKTEKVTTMLAPELAEAVDAYWRRAGFASRSEWMRLLIDVEMDKVLFRVESERAEE